LLVNSSAKSWRFLWVLLPCAAILTLAAWLRGAEYDEQYTLFLTAGVARPVWPMTVFPAGLARQLQSGNASFAMIARDLRMTDVHPPLYFWLVALWRAGFGHGLFEARMLSVVLGLGSLALTGVIARLSGLQPILAVSLTIGCYGFTYTSVVARGFALAELLLLGGIACLLGSRRIWHFLLAGALLGAATMSNYLAVFVAVACLLAVGLETARRRGRQPIDGPRRNRPTPYHAIGATLGFACFLPADLWWFMAQRGSRPGQFPPFSWSLSAVRLTARFAGDLLGGLPLYVEGPASAAVSALLGLLLLWIVVRVVWRWSHIGIGENRNLFALAALAPVCGLLILGAIFNATPIEVRYLSFATPFIGLLLAGALGTRDAAVLLAVQAAAITGLMLAPSTMQPARAAARAAATLIAGPARDGVVLLPLGNDGVGVTGAFAIESPPSLPLLLVRARDSPEQILVHVAAWHRVVLALLEQDDSSRAESAAMRRAFNISAWREVARGPHVAVYERVADPE
jgi:hypothetical protein